MGRTAAVLLSDGTLERRPFRGSDALYEVVRCACSDDREERYDSIGSFFCCVEGRTYVWGIVLNKLMDSNHRLVKED